MIVTSSPYPLLEVTDGEDQETMGSKTKFWWRQTPAQPRWLFKKPRRGADEAWSEKIAAELAKALGIPAAIAEFARDQYGSVGIAVRDFTNNGAYQLHHGNQLLARRVQDYPTQAPGKVKEHTVEHVFEVLGQPEIGVPELSSEFRSLRHPAEFFVGYLLLDAWIGNTDRHHENWGILEIEGRFEIAPSYDHASSLGRELTHERRLEMLTTRDRPRQLPAYLARARSAFYSAEDPQKQLSPRAAWLRAAHFQPKAGEFWLSRLRAARPELHQEILAKIPDAIMNQTAKELVDCFLIHTRTTLERSLKDQCSS